ncbi:hypothetical protein Ahy_B06g081293 isoform A [Arachis hypogaea]|uniref:J domain-containing protein n=1 Tax=Arachis hypogaea TaxID=3818 RepID=A0A444YKS0_ARAHY|nr:hypothetical protein Ahy_B06g081293 isoform A [Arachis hypogaea]
MASAVSNALFPNQLTLSHTHTSRHRPQPSPFLLRFHNTWSTRAKLFCSAASAAGAGSSSSNPDGDFNPYEVLGVSPIERFDMIKAAYAKKKKEAEINGDEATASRVSFLLSHPFILGQTMLEKAYDKLMMAQLTNRKKGVTFGSFKVSKDIKYADKQPILPWGPRFAKSTTNDTRINLAISAVFTAWILVRRSAEYKPLQFLAFAFVYRLFEKLKSFESPATRTYNEEGEDTGEGLRMGKRLLRSLALVFGCVAVSSVGYTIFLNIIEYAGGFIPAALYNSQELVITTSSAVMLYILATYYR